MPTTTPISEVSRPVAKPESCTPNSAVTRALPLMSGSGAWERDADTGDELFAYIPSWVVPRLTALTSPNYTHQSYVDATPTVAEANTGTRTPLMSRNRACNGILRMAAVQRISPTPTLAWT